MVCLFAFIVLVLLVAIPLGISHSKKTTTAWTQAAGQLGLHFLPPGLFQRRNMQGNYHGFRVTVETVTRGSGKNSKTYTRFAARYPKSLGLGLRLSREGFFAGVTKMFGAQDIQVGDAAFDRDIMVKGANPRTVRDFLTSARRVRIHRFLTNYHHATIDDAGVEWETRGVVRDAERIVANVRAVVRIAWYLTGDREEDRVFERVMTAQEQGRPEESLEILKEHSSKRKPPVRFVPVAPLPAVATPESTEASEPVAEEEFHPEPVEEQLLEGELLYMSGRRQEAKEVFEQARAESPEDTELRDWTEHVQREPAAPAPAVTATADSSLKVKAVCEVLFDPSKPSFSVNETFEQQYAGRQVRWSGVLQRVDPLGYDLVFKDRSGCKAVLNVHELVSVYGSREIRAVVHFAESDLEPLKNQVGDTVQFEGQLLQADGFMRNLFVADARRV